MYELCARSILKENFCAHQVF